MIDKTGWPAFPLHEKNSDGTVYQHHFGMTLRDYFAAKAMQTMIAYDDYNIHKVASFAYEAADAMLAARSK